MSKAQAHLIAKYPRIDAEETKLLQGLRKYTRRHIRVYRDLITPQKDLPLEVAMMIDNFHGLLDLLENNLKDS